MYKHFLDVHLHREVSYGNENKEQIMSKKFFFFFFFFFGDLEKFPELCKKNFFFFFFFFLLS